MRCLICAVTRCVGYKCQCINHINNTRSTLSSPRIYKGVSKSSRTVLVKRSLLNVDVKFQHHFHNTPTLHEYSGPSVSAMLGSIPGNPFLELYQVPAAIPLESLQWCRIFDPSSVCSCHYLILQGLLATTLQKDNTEVRRL